MAALSAFGIYSLVGKMLILFSLITIGVWSQQVADRVRILGDGGHAGKIGEVVMDDGVKLHVLLSCGTRVRIASHMLEIFVLALRCTVAIATVQSQEGIALPA